VRFHFASHHSELCLIYVRADPEIAFVDYLKKAYNLSGQAADSLAYALALCSTPSGTSSLFEYALAILCSPLYRTRCRSPRSPAIMEHHSFRRSIWTVTLPRWSLRWSWRSCRRILKVSTTSSFSLPSTLTNFSSKCQNLRCLGRRSNSRSTSPTTLPLPTYRYTGPRISTTFHGSRESSSPSLQPLGNARNDKTAWNSRSTGRRGETHDVHR